MHGSKGRVRKQLVDEINITPLTDVFLVLLIIMMVVAPMVDSMRRDIALPNLDGGKTLTRPKITVEITPAGEFYVDGALQPREELARAITAAAQGAREGDLILRADAQARGVEVLEVYRAAGEAGLKELKVALQAPGTSQTAGSNPAPGEEPAVP